MRGEICEAHIKRFNTISAVIIKFCGTTNSKESIYIQVTIFNDFGQYSTMDPFFPYKIHMSSTWCHQYAVLFHLNFSRARRLPPSHIFPPILQSSRHLFRRLESVVQNIPSKGTQNNLVSLFCLRFMKQQYVELILIE